MNTAKTIPSVSVKYAADERSMKANAGPENGSNSKGKDLNDPVHVGLIKCSGDIHGGEI